MFRKIRDLISKINRSIINKCRDKNNKDDKNYSEVSNDNPLQEKLINNEKKEQIGNCIMELKIIDNKKTTLKINKCQAHQEEKTPSLLKEETKETENKTSSQSLAGTTVESKSESDCNKIEEVRD